MAELTISPEEIRSAIEGYVSSYTPEASREEVGIVSEAVVIAVVVLALIGAYGEWEYESQRE